METKEELDLLHAEILNLFNYIQRVRKEVAAITRVDEGNGRFDNMSDQLDAIVQATAEATNSIMEIVEQNSDTLQKIRDKTEDPEIRALLDEVENNSSNIFEACTFQDITGQRVTKIARSVTYVESRVNSLIEIFGKEHLENVEIEDEVEKTEDEKLLSGPQLEGEGISQDEIDKLFD
ncbi:MAG: protein phosphatase CheZ [Rhodospirillales bacterium]